MNGIAEILDKIDSVMYYPVLIVVMAAAGLYFTVRTKGVQIRLFGEALGVIREKPDDKNHISSLQAMLVSTASRVGTGNIVGVSTAICLGGAGAVFWMWVMCVVATSSAFIESTLAQIYKRRGRDGSCYGGPAYYIEKALHAPWLSAVFCVFLIATYAVGFNMLASYNLQSTFAAYSFYDKGTTPFIVGLVIALLVGYCIIGGGRRIVKFTGVIVPVMGISYVVVSLVVIAAHIDLVPSMFGMIFSDAFNFRSIASGVAGSCLVYGIKRGLYSNEAGVGSAPNAAAGAKVSHPVSQGLVQMLSVYIDTLLLCTATALMCLASGVERSAEVSGAPYVQNAISTVFGQAGAVFITAAMVLFAFTTLIGNLYYVDNALIYLNGKKEPSKLFMRIFHAACAIVVLVGAGIPMDAAWAVADIMMGGMTFINLPVCVILGKYAIRALDDYTRQRREMRRAGRRGQPAFRAKDVGLDESGLDYWKDGD